MRKKLLLGFCALFMFSIYSIAQTTATGKVVDEKGAAISGATVFEKGTKNGTTTASDGSYSLKVKAGAKLVVSSVGYEDYTVAAGSGVKTALANTSKDIAEVVVTAFGIKREKKALGFAQQEVKGSDLNAASNGNALGALSGKVAGLQVTSSSGTPGAASYLRLRGVSSLGGGQPLIVIDGMPIDNSTDGSSLGNVSQSNRGIDINPEDIENVSILKGPSASALYGTQGTDGVILITTKRGKKGKNGSTLNMEYSYSITADKVNRLPELQNMYTQGTGGNIRTPAQHTSLSWGPKRDTLKWNGISNIYDINGGIVGKSNPAGVKDFVPYDNAGKFFETGISQTHNVSFGSMNEMSSYRFSYSNLYSKGIVPTSTFERNSFSLTVDTKLADNLKAGVSANYVISGGNRIQEGSNISGLMLGLLRTPISFDNSNGATDPTDKLAYELADGRQRSYRGIGDANAGYVWYDNPYWTINKNLFKDEVNRILTNTYLTYTPFKWLTITDRIGLDHYGDDRKSNFAKHSAALPSGQVTLQSIVYNHVNNDLLVNMNHKLSNDLDGSLLLGYNLYSEKYSRSTLQGTGLTILDFNDLSNTSSQTTTNTSYVLRRKALFAQSKVAYKNYLFFDASIRAENSSAFVSAAQTKGAWFYFPSVSSSLIFTDALKLPNKILSYGKVRIAYGEAGRLPSVYSTNNFYRSALVADGWTSGLTFPISGNQAVFGGVLGNANLRPERTGTIDIGTELRFFNGRIGLDFTYYSSKSKDLLTLVPLSASTGYGNIYTNAATIENKGIELSLTGTPVKTKNFTWDVLVNYSSNKSNVSEIAPGIQNLFLGGFTGGSIYAVKDNPFGMIYGADFYRTPAGKLVIQDDPTNTFYGYPIMNSSSKAIGNPNPKWIGGLRNTLTYKNISLSFLFDTKQKFDMWNGTRGALVNFGVAKETENRGSDKTFDGVLGHIDATGNIIYNGGSPKDNNVVVKPGQPWYQGGGAGGGFNGPAAQFVEDASFTKLREVSLSYSFEIKGTLHKYVKDITLTFVARNLWLITSYRGIDPETSLAGSNALGIDYFNNPSTKTFGGTVKIKF